MTEELAGGPSRVGMPRGPSVRAALCSLGWKVLGEGSRLSQGPCLHLQQILRCRLSSLNPLPGNFLLVVASILT